MASSPIPAEGSELKGSTQESTHESTQGSARQSNHGSAIRAVYAVFFLESAVLGNWIPRIPDIKAALDLSEGQLGLCLLAMPVGTVLGLLVAGRLTESLGIRRSLQLALPAWALLFLAPALVTSMGQLFVSLALCGVAVGLVEVAMNTEADLIERRSGRRVMSRCHGFWSLGSMVGALFASGVAQLGVALQPHFLVIMPALALLSWWASSSLPRLPRAVNAAPQASDSSVFRLPDRAIVALCIMPLGIMSIEGAFIDWSAVFMRSVLEASSLVLGVTYALFSVNMAIVRLLGDQLASRFGDLLVVRLSAAGAIVGIIVFALAPSVPIAIVGAALSGMGVAVVYPLAVSAAARRPGRSSADNVAAITMISFGAFFVAPPFIGFVAEAANLRVALLALVPGAVLTLYLSGEVVKVPAPVRSSQSDLQEVN